MTDRIGALFRVRDRIYADSMALLRLDDEYDVEQNRAGWRVLTGGGSVMCTEVEDQPPLPNQRGKLYSLTAEGVALVDVCSAWCKQGLVKPVGNYDAWPGACTHACACSPCQARRTDQGEANAAAASPPAAPAPIHADRSGDGDPPASRNGDPGALLWRAAMALRNGAGEAEIAAFVARAQVVGGTAARVASIVRELDGLMRGDPVSRAIFAELLELSEVEQYLAFTLGLPMHEGFAEDLREAVSEAFTGVARRILEVNE